MAAGQGAFTPHHPLSWEGMGAEDKGCRGVKMVEGLWGQEGRGARGVGRVGSVWGQGLGGWEG